MVSLESNSTLSSESSFVSLNFDCLFLFLVEFLLDLNDPRILLKANSLRAVGKARAFAFESLAFGSFVFFRFFSFESFKSRPFTSTGFGLVAPESIGFELVSLDSIGSVAESDTPKSRSESLSSERSSSVVSADLSASLNASILSGQRH